ncbi:hypothetical protein ACFGVR_11925 [Mucilaginibacter sp. AW1-3]
MKKLILYFSIFLFAAQANAQKNYYLSPVKMDSMVSVSMPQEFAKSKAGGQDIYSGNGRYGSMLAIRTINPVSQQSVKNPKGLDNVFKEYVKKVQQSLSQGTIVNDHDTTVGKLTARDFVLQVDTGGGLEVRHFTLVYTKTVTYTFEYLYSDFRKDLAIGEMKAFLGSIRVSPELTTANQYITVPQRFPVATVVIIAGALFIIVGAVVFIRRKPNLAT